MEERIPIDLEMEIEAIEMGNNVKKRPKIQRVPLCLGGKGFETYFTPQIISFGPFHYDQPYVRIGEDYKTTWTAKYLVDTKQQKPYGELLGRINHHRDELLDSFLLRNLDSARDEKWKESNWSWIMDGCSILQVLDKFIHDDPEKELNVSFEHLFRVQEDMLLLENQVPSKLLKLICNDNAKFDRCLHNFLSIHSLRITGKQDLKLDEAEEDDPIHLLDYLRRALIKIQRQQLVGKEPIDSDACQRKYKTKYQLKSIRNLINNGIRVELNTIDKVLYPTFNSDSGTLLLPYITVANSAMLFFLNMMAYEMCPDFRNDFEITSFVAFLSCLIETPEDVKELRSCVVLINEVATDKEVSDLFNQIDTLRLPETEIRLYQRTNE